MALTEHDVADLLGVLQSVRNDRRQLVTSDRLEELRMALRMHDGEMFLAARQADIRAIAAAHDPERG